MYVITENLLNIAIVLFILVYLYFVDKIKKIIP